MSQKDEFQSIIEFVTEQLDAKWAILITHDKADNVVAVHNSHYKSVPFVRRLESKLFEGLEIYDVTDEAEA